MNIESAVALAVSVSLFVMIITFEAPLTLKVVALVVGGGNLALALMSLRDKDED